MKIEYSSIQGSSEWNEDALIINHDLKVYGVADGATSIVPYRSETGETGGRLASQIIKKTFEETTSDDIPLENTLFKANTTLREQMIQSGIDTTHKECIWTSGAAIIKIKETQIEYTHTGDCFIIALYKDGSYRLLTKDHVATLDNNLIDQINIMNKNKQKNTTEVMKGIVKENKKHINTLQGYPVLDGSEEAPCFFESGHINRINLTGVIISSDGLLMHEEVNALETIDPIARLVKEISLVGVDGFISYLNTLESRDKACSRFPRFKISDDKTAIFINL